ncbi:MAG: DUF4397 domain-containing protein [Parafilimonas sp.]
MKKLPLVILVAMCTLIFATSCNLNNNDTTNPQASYFLVANISPDAPPLTLYSNGSPTQIQGLPSGLYTLYFQATPGSYNFAFYDSASTTTPVLSNTVSINANSYYSYFVIDSFSKVKSTFVQDNLKATTSDSAFVRFLNFSPNAGVVNLSEVTGDSTYYSNRTFNDQVATTGYADFNRLKLRAGGVYNFQLKQPDGTFLASKLDTLLGGHTYTLFAKGNVNGTGSQAIGLGQIVNN